MGSAYRYRDPGLSSLEQQLADGGYPAGSCCSSLTVEMPNVGCNVQDVCMRTNCKLLCSSAAQAGPHTAVALGILAFESYNSPQGALRPAKEYAKVNKTYNVLAACPMQAAAFTFSLGKEPFNIMLWDALSTHLLCEGLVRVGATMKACHLALRPQQLLLGIGHHTSRPLQRCWVACALQPLLLTKDV